MVCARGGTADRTADRPSAAPGGLLRSPPCGVERAVSGVKSPRRLGLKVDLAIPVGGTLVGRNDKFKKSFNFKYVWLPGPDSNQRPTAIGGRACHVLDEGTMSGSIVAAVIGFVVGTHRSFEPPAYAGFHNPTKEPGCELRCFRASDQPDLKLAEGWWDVPTCRIDCDTTPREPDHSYVERDGPCRTGEAAYAAPWQTTAALMPEPRKGK
jgi:hypothetical protein